MLLFIAGIRFLHSFIVMHQYIGASLVPYVQQYNMQVQDCNLQISFLRRQVDESFNLPSEICRFCLDIGNLIFLQSLPTQSN